MFRKRSLQVDVMSTVKDVQRINKIARFFVGVRTVRFNYEWPSEDEANRMQLFVDSDGAGCAVTRRSTSGGLVKLGTRSLTKWLST